MDSFILMGDMFMLIDLRMSIGLRRFLLVYVLTIYVAILAVLIHCIWKL